jgi:hypothetical protein
VLKVRTAPVRESPTIMAGRTTVTGTAADAALTSRSPSYLLRS